MLVALPMLVAACAGPSAGGGASGTGDATGQAPGQAYDGAGARTPAATVSASGAAAFAALPDDLRARAGVAVTPVRSAGTASTWALTWGGRISGPAWSTIKVPLAVAAGGRDPDAQRRALEQSDNAAATQLWDGLGGGATAAAAVQAELAAGGDGDTRVQDVEVRPPYTPYGQTEWSLPRAAAYAATLPCRSATAAAYDALHRVAAGQRWGLGTIGAEAYKGGWGPLPDGGYIVRQIGVVATPDGGRVAVALLVADGRGYDAATAEASVLARFVQERLGELPGGRC